MERFPKKYAVADLVSLTILWVFVIFLVNPRGEFPINDDFFYWLDVKQLLAEGVYRPTGFESATLVTHILWGGIFCELFGFSHEVLRFSVLCISLIGMLSLYSLIRQLNPSRGLAIFSTLIIMFNPVYFSLSFSFMSDVTFSTFMIASVLFFVRYISGESNLDLMIGAFFSVMAILCRQAGLAVPMAFGVSILFRSGLKGRYVFVSLVPIILGFLSYFLFSNWFVGVVKNGEFYGHFERYFFDSIKYPNILISNLLNNGFIALIYIGLFIFPLIAAFFAFGLKKDRSKIFYVVFIVSAIYLVFSAMYDGVLMPMVGNYIGETGVGPLFMLSLKKSPYLPKFSYGFWLSLTVVGLIGASAMLAIMVSRCISMVSHFKDLISDRVAVIEFFLLLVFVIYLTPFLVTWFFDRYLIPPAIIFLLLMVCRMRGAVFSEKSISAFAMILLASFGLFSICSTHDFLSLNRARWAALNSLLNENVAPSQIDGGYEFNGLYLLHDYERNKAKIWGNQEELDPYIIAFGEMSGYGLLRSYEFVRWLSPGLGKIHVLRRLSKEVVDSDLCGQICQGK